MPVTSAIYSTVNNKSNADTDLTQSQYHLQLAATFPNCALPNIFHVSLPPVSTRVLGGLCRVQHRRKDLESTLVIDPRHCWWYFLLTCVCRPLDFSCSVTKYQKRLRVSNSVGRSWTNQPIKCSWHGDWPNSVWSVTARAVDTSGVLRYDIRFNSL